MTLWRFGACVAGWNRAQGGEERSAAAPSDEEFEAMKAAHAALDAHRGGNG